MRHWIIIGVLLAPLAPAGGQASLLNASTVQANRREQAVVEQLAASFAIELANTKRVFSQDQLRQYRRIKALEIRARKEREVAGRTIADLAAENAQLRAERTTLANQVSAAHPEIADEAANYRRDIERWFTGADPRALDLVARAGAGDDAVLPELERHYQDRSAERTQVVQMAAQASAKQDLAEAGQFLAVARIVYLRGGITLADFIQKSEHAKNLGLTASWAADQLAYLYHSAGDGKKAVETAKQSVAAANTDLEQVIARRYLASYLRHQGRLDEARTEISKARDVLERQSASTLARPGWQAASGQVYDELGTVGYAAKDYAKAYAGYEKAYAVYLAMYDASRNIKHLYNLNFILRKVPYMARATDRRDRAIYLFREHEKYGALLYKADPRNVDYIDAWSSSLMSGAQADLMEGRKPEAASKAAKATQAARKLVAIDPSNPSNQWGLWSTLTSESSLLKDIGYTNEAIRKVDEAILISKRLSDAEPQSASKAEDYGDTLEKRAWVIGKRSELRAAFAQFDDMRKRGMDPAYWRSQWARIKGQLE